MQTISICLYSYRNKDLYNIVSRLVDSCSDKNNFIFKVVDQNNTIRDEISLLSKNNIKVMYEYVFWDSIDSPIKYKQNFLNGIVSKYHLQISDRVTLPKDWDIDFLNICGDSIISGAGVRGYEIKNKFMLKKTFSDSMDFSESNVIDRDLIFSKTPILKSIGFPTNLKYYGEEEIMSFFAKIKNISIISMPSNIVYFKGDSLEDKDYVPFSLYHNYNDIINFYKENVSRLQEFGTMKDIYPLPYISNDVEYDIRKSKIDMVGGERYLDKTAMVD